MIAPGLIREALVYTLSNFHDGEFGNQNANSLLMKQWVGKANNEQRTDFNLKVANRMKELGWNAESEVNVTRLLGKSFEKDYGDIDVIAWNEESQRVLLIECKDLHYKKTYGEIAEQLSDFRGENKVILRKGKNKEEPDALKKHLNRVEIVGANLDAASKFTGITPINGVEGYVVFKNYVPMQFTWGKFQHSTKLALYEELDKL